MLFYETEIKEKLKKLPDIQKKEVLDFADHLILFVNLPDLFPLVPQLQKILIKRYIICDIC